MTSCPSSLIFHVPGDRSDHLFSTQPNALLLGTVITRAKPSEWLPIFPRPRNTDWGLVHAVLQVTTRGGDFERRNIGRHQGGTADAPGEGYHVTVEVKTHVGGAYPRSASIAAGGHGSAPHRADVRVTVKDRLHCPVAGRPVCARLEGGAGAAGVPALLTLSGTTDINGQAVGTLKSSDRKETATVSVTHVGDTGLSEPATAAVRFDWAQKTSWVSRPKWKRVGSGNTETVTMTWSGSPLEGHDLRFWITRVGLADGTTVGYRDADLYATITNVPGPTDSRGMVTATICCHAETWADWDWLHVTWWDFSVND